MREVSEDVGERAQFRRRVDGPCGVGRRVQDDPFGALVEGAGHGFGRELEPDLLAAGNDDGCAVVGEHHVRVGDPEGGGHHHFVAGVEGGHEGRENHLLGAASDGDLSRGVVQAGAQLDGLQDGLLQGGGSGDGSVFGLPLADRCDGCGLDVLGGVKVWLADRQVQDPAPFRLQLTHTGSGGHAGGGLDAGHPRCGFKFRHGLFLGIQEGAVLASSTLGNPGRYG